MKKKKKNEKEHAKNKCDVINIGKYDVTGQQKHMQTCKNASRSPK